MRSLDFFIEEIENPYIRDNFKTLQEVLRAENLLSADFQHFELEFDKAVTSVDIRHNLNYVPLDVIQTWTTPGVTVTWAYNKFTRETIRLSTSAACRIRVFIGAYRKGIRG